MSCKNCTAQLSENDNYCANCGAKQITNRLTIKNLTEEAISRFFNVDNLFFKTFISLLKNPDDVILSFINGVRKKYLNALSYFALSVTVSGLVLFFGKNFFPELLENPFSNSGVSTNSIMEYQSIMAFLWIPFYALISKTIFYKNKQLNYTEHIIIYLYTIAQISIFSLPFHIALLFAGINYIYISYITIVFMIAYNAYVLKRIFELSVGKIIWKSIQFILLLLALMIIFGIVMVILGVATKAAS